MTHRGMLRACSIGVVLGIAFGSMYTMGQAAPSPHTFDMAVLLASGRRVWLPSVIAVHPGERVTLNLKNEQGEAHGFSIDEYGIHVIVQPKGTQQVTFTAKPGVSRFYCQLHPAHIGGQVIVL